ncbi:hypothetical protein M501DRAFT_986657 [Patellaria atrata CBS 101060]|uniref:Uncharacterized protein n=1 Tax=Patellaria atrata CBS 101060 TaxID=1346257 RepID=A0A9P4VQ21_9PEZI|nr:hypothetical protein M501DRAFT_986657 [Patellaria atrata CBS 101060]
MRCSITAIALAALAIGQAAAGPFRHAQLHRRKITMPENIQYAEKRSLLSAVDEANLIGKLQLKQLGVNAVSKCAHSWIGKDGPYVNEVVNESGEDLTVVVWGPMGSWVNAVQPQITISLANGTSTHISFASGAIGALSAVYPDTTNVMGQLYNTWIEFTFAPMGVVDVSREVNMNGHVMSIEGPDCVSDMDTCVFKCSVDPATGVAPETCLEPYELVNCENGSQPGATKGLHFGAETGGCGWLFKESAKFRTVFGA